jgi:hypothetical protein
MNKTEGSDAEVKKLEMRCKTLEAQLRQSITKKEHHEIVLEFEDKMTDMERQIAAQEKKIAEQEKALVRTKGELQSTLSLSAQISDVGASLATLDKSLGEQLKSVDSIAMKVSQGTVPVAVHQQSLAKIGELEEQVRAMVPKSDMAELQKRYEEANRQIGKMVKASEHDALKRRVAELESAVSSMVPSEQLAESEKQVRELKMRLAEHVPQSIYDELVSRVVQLAEDVTGGATTVDEQSGLQEEPVEPAPGEPTRPEPTNPAQAPERLPTVPMEAAAPETPAADGTELTQEPEIREVGSHLAEMKTDAEEAAQGAPAPSAPSERLAPAFRFEETDIEVSSGPEFANALANVPTKALELDVRSGEFERWFREALSDATTADLLGRVRAREVSGDELRNQVKSAVSKYAKEREAPMEAQPSQQTTA